MSTAWQKQGERSNRLALTTICWIAQHLGRPAARAILYPITFYFLLFAPAQRRASRDYLKRVLERMPTWLDVARHIHWFASTILDRVFFLTGRFDVFDIGFPSVNLPLSYASRGQGAVLLGGHLGSFEVLRSYAIRKCPLPIKILMYEEHNPMIIDVLNGLNPDVADMVIHLGQPESLLQVKESIEAGYAVGMLGDRVLGDEKTVECQFLGDMVSFPTAPIVIAAALQAPVILFFGLYLGGSRYEIHFELLAERIVLGRSTRQRDIQRWTQCYVARLEWYTRRAPYNWFNFFDYWQDESCSSTKRASGG
jgi:predicted LPLAT superfamily acyltransferase